MARQNPWLCDREKLRDILAAIDRIVTLCSAGKLLSKMSLIQVWFIQNLQIIGEVSRSRRPVCLRSQFKDLRHTNLVSVSWQALQFGAAFRAEAIGGNVLCPTATAKN